MYTSILVSVSIGLAVPPMLKEAFAGELPWSEVAEYMFVLAFIGTISGMVIMSMNYPFILHTCSYSIGLVVVLIFSHINKNLVKKINAWKPKSSMPVMPVAQFNHMSAHLLL